MITSVNVLRFNHRQRYISFPLAVAQTVLVRERQRYGLVDEMRDALNYVIYGSSENIENSSRRNTGSKYPWKWGTEMDPFPIPWTSHSSIIPFPIINSNR